MTNSTEEQDQAAKRWMIVGAYQAGASERKIARLSGLSTTAVRHIILNYQQTGIPSIPKKVPKRVREKLIVEYDEDGNIIESEDEEDEEEQDHESSRKRTKYDESSQSPNRLPPPSKMDQTIRGYEEAGMN
ncbi:hypothetical protein G6F70_006883 [Rhizopus microsporus]|uniref:Uncharacterized protein n=1 Tax=Rhizopus microsporus TaxID=58291 RepID=A0A1X0RMY2_RHIZD|nr:hypothetical protein G6F71_006967 [Rhizopus microsporus]KAG1197129.1 hypothetical protein G6F70_006883 [Rhizopus microsporus]KAG1208794.1 hypothetical protein G6F69_006914 [Rhizopus microsporus]KAG1230338.1 hypothetical protein G6F67_006530 [Rhizopus microsporus]KAG1262313.1 hypothetical protein G6F68_006031 [Rhizopus microsporus]